jgi:hypothetical protein
MILVLIFEEEKGVFFFRLGIRHCSTESKLVEAMKIQNIHLISLN